MLFGVILYFVLAVGLLALAFFAPAREWLVATTQHWWSRGLTAGSGLADAGQRRVRGASHSAGGWVGRFVGWARAHALLCSAGLVVVMGVPLAAGVLRVLFPASSYDHTLSRPVDERVADLLRGEMLVAPPPLPPEMFTTREVEQARPMTATASRQWELLDEGFRSRLLMVFKLMRETHGYDMVLLEGYRSPERQAALAALGPTVTQAGPYESLHQHGMAADCAFVKNGKIVITERDPWAMLGYEKYGEVARSLGLTWGGDWRSLKDYGHVEWRRSARSKPDDSAKATTPP
ncbi:M15 family metallopeptidase [Ideonella sp. DXS29W]|uniref:M15 family metallopeptidase n=1 Tax=Ideonella lacteola TaxID=2984193 RepID=A0ABU9BT67_9BURK